MPGSEYHWFHEWRPRDVATAMVYGKTPPHRAKARDLRKVSGPTLQHRMEQSVNKGKFDVFDRLAGESDRRDTARAAARTAKQEKAAAVEQRRAEHLDRLMSEGHDHESAVEKAYGIPVQKQRDQNALAQLRASGHDGAGLTAAARKAHTAETHSRYVAAEEATNGHMLNAAGKAAKVNPKSLFTGPESRARKYASPELAEFFDQHGRPSFDEYLAEVRGHMQSASRMRSGRSDFHASAGDRTRVDLAWDPSKHPRVASGAGGGEFTSAQQSAGGKPRDAKAAEAQKDTDAKGQFDQLKAMDTAKQRAYLATLTPAQRQALTAFAYSAKTSDPKIVAARIALANANARAGKAGARKPRTVTARQPSTVTARKPRTVQASAAVRPRLDLAATVPGPAARKRMAADGVALPDGSYPCPDKAALSNAIQAYGRAPAAKRPKVVAHIRKHARRLGAMGDPKVQNFLSAHSSGS